MLTRGVAREITTAATATNYYTTSTAATADANLYYYCYI